MKVKLKISNRDFMTMRTSQQFPQQVVLPAAFKGCLAFVFEISNSDRWEVEDGEVVPSYDLVEVKCDCEMNKKNDIRSIQSDVNLAKLHLDSIERWIEKIIKRQENEEF